MAYGETIGCRVLHSRQASGAWGPWEDSDLFMPLEISDRCAPDYAVAKMEYNFPKAARHVWDWRKDFGPDDAVAIVTNVSEGDPERRVLFSGHITENQWEFTRAESATVAAVGPAFRLLRDSMYLVYGQARASKAGTVNLFSGLPCSFNAGGYPNRSAAKSTIRAAAGSVSATTAFTFADLYSGGVQYWRFADALEYLLAAYNAAEYYVLNPTITAAMRADPACVQVDCDGLGLWEALARVCQQASYDLACVTTIGRAGVPAKHEAGEFYTAMSIVKRGQGTELILDHQASGAMDLDATNLFAGRVAENVASCVTAPVIAGARELFEITVELGKCWDAADLALASGESVMLPGEEETLADTDYVKNFCVGGSNFHLHADAGRLWDANTDGYYSAAPTSLSVPDMAALCGQEAGGWPVMPYEAMRLLTRLIDSPQSGGVETFVEFSIDSGVTWHHLTCGAQIPHGRLGVYINQHNLSAIVPPGGDKTADNLMQMLMTTPATVEMRLTCSVASPFRNILAAQRRVTAGTVFATAAWFEREKLGQVRTRAASSRFAATDLPADTMTASAKVSAARAHWDWSGPLARTLSAAAAEAQDANEDRFIEGSFTLEWIEPDAELTNVVKKIGGINVDLGANAGASKRYPRVVGRVYHLAGNTQQTELILDTDRQMAVK
ncbi:MAG: hypothetical protein PHU85_15680 [Phycisphaerae bacterium]|nr:hypothetical protein [Phycisphaerae bacterium]